MTVYPDSKQSNGTSSVCSALHTQQVHTQHLSNDKNYQKFLNAYKMM